jgi:DNA-binding SARP family transcriptional activator
VQITVRVLGPIEISTGERNIRLAGQKQRALVAALALDIGKIVSVTQLVDVLWDSSPPASARAKIQGHVSALRQTIGQRGPDPDGPLLTRPPGYILNPQQVALDLTGFTELTGSARSAADSGQGKVASELLATALGLWRGTAFADVASTRISAAAAALEERRLLAVEAKARADLACGRYETVTTELAVWLTSNPLRERLRALIMEGLWGLGCRAEALALYRAGRQALVDELGLEPGPELTRLHAGILADNDPGAHAGPANAGHDFDGDPQAHTHRTGLGARPLPASPGTGSSW